MSLNVEQTNELFGEMSARWYQVAVRNQVADALREGHTRICIIQPTGTGKTLSSGLILVSAEIRQILGVKDNQKMRVLFVSHRHRLLSQAEKTYSVDENIEVISQSVMSPIPGDIKFDVVIHDECHHEATMSFQHRLEQITAAPMIGLTATPDRNDRRLCKFSKFIEPLTRDEAVAQGFLAKSYINTFCDAPTRSHVDMCSEIVDLCGDEMGQTMVFVRTKAEAQQLHEVLQEKGLSSALMIDISERELNKQLEAFEAGEHQFNISCNKLGEGVDVKGCESVLIGRTIRSYGLLNQMIGRASRPDCDCRIYETINPLSDANLESTVVVGTPESHNLWYKVRGQWRTHQLT